MSFYERQPTKSRNASDAVNSLLEYNFKPEQIQLSNFQKLSGGNGMKKGKKIIFCP